MDKYKWPSDNAPSDELPNDVKAAIITLQNCLDQELKLPEICMEVIDDMLINNLN